MNRLHFEGVSWCVKLVDVVNYIYLVDYVSYFGRGMSALTSFERIFQLVHLLKKNMHDRIESSQLGLSPMHVRVLKIIAKKPLCTAVDIAQFLGRDKAQVTRILNSLVEQKFITKIPNPDDKRSQCLQIDDDGLEVMRRLGQIEAEVLADMCRSLTDEDMQRFEEIVAQMSINLTI